MALVIQEGAAQTISANLTTVATNNENELAVEDSWRQYYQAGVNPLSAATTAMLSVHDEQPQDQNLVYEGYTLKPAQPQHNTHDVQPTVATTALPEIWR
ncbi:protein grainyhead-like [Tropilaelaps mercedesae]|uniref:Protein grainyhead-like n=1 Tax=Tropilaelaps mercedesae TaxID=418985 RepID=A0A1V9X5Z4_9ACAR|nr:protein grainyhead-like [Tropilaelaps mercedesae]